MARKRLSEAGAQAESDLKYWGHFVGRQFAADGYPSDCTLSNLLSSRSDLNPASPQFGINVPDMPPEAWRINAIVMHLRTELRHVLIARYCIPVEYATGHPFDSRFIAAALNLHVRSYFRLLHDARERFLRLKVGGVNNLSFGSVGGPEVIA